jgi:hypothetical protein
MKRHKTRVGYGDWDLTTTGTSTAMIINGTSANTTYTTLLSDRINNAITRENEVISHTNTMAESINAIRELLDITEDIPNESEYQDGEELGISI